MALGLGTAAAEAVPVAVVERDRVRVGKGEGLGLGDWEGEGERGLRLAEPEAVGVADVVTWGDGDGLQVHDDDGEKGAVKERVAVKGEECVGVAEDMEGLGVEVWVGVMDEERVAREGVEVRGADRESVTVRVAVDGERVGRVELRVWETEGEGVAEGVGVRPVERE